jgi:uncharacterized protein with HEPN domain
MPDHSTAPTEHALIQEITERLPSGSQDLVPSAAETDFPVALRGYDRLAVDAYVRRTSQLVAELQATRSPQDAVRRALGRVGEEVSGILQRAHETAEQITAQSRIDAEERLESARIQAEEITASAHRRLAELDAETDRIWAERHRIVEDARELATQLVALADSAAQRFPAAEDPAQEPSEELTVRIEDSAEATETMAAIDPDEPIDPHEPIEPGEPIEPDEPLS